MEQPPAMPARSSGIPRPTSRLPVLRSSGSQSQLRSPASTEQLRKKTSLSSLSRASPAPQALQKKPSRSSLVRSSTPSTATSTNTASSRASLISTKRAIPGSGQVRTASSDAAGFKKPTVRPSPSLTRVPPRPTKAANTSQNDVLCDLDGFRSVSRASSRASSRADFRGPETDHSPENEEVAVQPAPRKARPSLSDRTIASLSQLPSSPAVSKSRRRSSFFNADNSMPPPLRPASALSNGRRPMTSDGTPQAAPVTPRRIVQPSQRGSLTAPGKRSVSAAHAGSVAGTPSKTSSIARPTSMMRKEPLSQMQNVQSTPKPRPLSNSKTMVARTPKSRPSIAGSFGQAISPPGTAVTTTPSTARRESLLGATPVTARKVSNSSAALREQIAKAKAARRSDVAPKTDETPPKTNSSQALREQIAKAKEAARRATAERPRTSTPPREAIVPDPAEIAEFDFGLDDPFNQRSKGSKSLLRKRIDGARTDGRLNIAAMGLSEVPEDVLNMYRYDPADNTVAWGEVVDLTSIIAADNEFKTLPDAMFPDVDVQTAMDSDDDANPQFGGVQNIDLHGNVLRELPVGLRRLMQLSKLNLSRNKLPLQAMDVITQICTLRELKLADNDLEGPFPASLSELSLLEILELQGNRLNSLPPEIRALTHLRTLNISDNRLADLPNELFTSVPIVELVASKNSFTGAFFDVDTVPHLQNLQLSSNSLTDFCLSGTILLPALKYLDLSGNRLSALPDMSSWTSLTTLLVGENQLSSLPEGFLSLQQLRNADFTANNLNKLDERIALMEGLENLTLAANPLRDRKFLTMNTEDIKRDLLSRIEPATVDNDLETTETPDKSAVGGTDNGWKLTPSGTLDLSFQNLTEVDEEGVAAFAETNDVRQLYLQQNYLPGIPSVTAQLSFLTVLDLSKNNIVIPLEHSLQLTKLRELRLNGNKMRSLEPITSLLSAPGLQHLDVSNNQISGSLPVLRDSFPELMRFMAGDNSIDEVSAESLQGLKIVNLSNNDIARLEPEIGLHAGTLTSLDVEGNKFRVPNYAILRKGTDAILTWLRDKIPSPTEEFFNPGSPGF